MSNNETKRKVELVKSILRKLHEGAKLEELKEEFRQISFTITPAELVMIEQQLISEGIQINEVLRLCDLHVQLFRDYLIDRELKDVPKGHPLDLLVRENELILKWSEALGMYANSILTSPNADIGRTYEQLVDLINNLRGLRLHYRKIQMLIFPYLERRGLIAVPRVLWGREDQVIVKIRKLRELLKDSGNKVDVVKDVASKSLEVSNEVKELVFRENKILFPAVWALFSEGEWAAMAEIAKDIGYLIPVDVEWVTEAKPVMPYEIVPKISDEEVRKLPTEFRELALKKLEPDTYNIVREGDIKLETGFLSKEEVDAVFRSLPLEITYADENDRVKYYTESKFSKGFVRTKTILGRRLLFCHPPRLEGIVKVNVERIKKGDEEFREYWTMVGDRIIRVIVTSVKSKEGKYLGTLEMVEDLTDVVRNPSEIMKKILIL